MMTRFSPAQVSLKDPAVFGPAFICPARLDLALVLGFGGWFHLKGEMSLTDLVRFLFFLGNLVWPMMGVGHVISLFQQGTVSLRRLNGPLEEPVEDRRTPSAGNGRPEGAPAVPQGAIEIRHLTFSYPGTERRVLDDVSLSVPVRSTVALVGAVGSGKSTLAHLIARLYEPPRATVFIDGRDARDLDLDSLRRAIGFVPQNPSCSRHGQGNLAFPIPPGRRWSRCSGPPRSQIAPRSAACRALRAAGAGGARRQPVGRPAPARNHRAGAAHAAPNPGADDCTASVDVGAPDPGRLKPLFGKPPLG